MTLNALLWATTRDRAVVSVRTPLRLDARDMPEPDLALLRPPVKQYRRTHPAPEQVLLLVEVAGVGRNLDRSAKSRMYADRGIPELWIVDLPGETVEVFRNLEGGEYSDVARHGRGAAVEPSLLPGARLLVDDVLG